MPFKRKYTVRKRKGYTKYGVKKNMNLKKRILQMQELKWFYLENALNQNSAATWTIGSFQLYGIAQGSANSQRIGTKIFLETIELSIEIKPGAVAAQQNGTCCRFIVWHQIRSNGADPVATDIFDKGTFAAPVVPDYKRMKSLDFYPRRVRIIYDKLHTMVATTNSTTNTVQAAAPMWMGIVKIKVNKWINYGGVTNTPADILNHNYGLGICSDGAACCTVKCNARLRYRDG